ncbi:hypothetical protein DLM_4227 [Aquitalea magnusonii]|uniref:Uncharacterized protein n=1 Tax=Aquitalea magnusonii TaxID=332411 RepID=A0A3G9GN41_9NEIS|nr:hypothetical protein DLM_4227 [Aquitalea magnusonii]
MASPCSTNRRSTRFILFSLLVFQKATGWPVRRGLSSANPCQASGQAWENKAW